MSPNPALRHLIIAQKCNVYARMLSEVYRCISHPESSAMSMQSRFFDLQDRYRKLSVQAYVALNCALCLDFTGSRLCLDGYNN